MAKIISRKKSYCIGFFEDGTCEVQDTDAGASFASSSVSKRATEAFPNASELYCPFKVSAYERIYANGKREIRR